MNKASDCTWDLFSLITSFGVKHDNFMFVFLFSSLALNAFIIFPTFFTLEKLSNNQILILLAIFIYLVYLIFNIFDHYKQFSRRELLYQLHYWCKFLVKDKWLVLLYEADKRNEYLSNNKGPSDITPYDNLSGILESRVFNQSYNTLLTSNQSGTELLNNLSPVALSRTPNLNLSRYTASLMYKILCFIGLIFVTLVSIQHYISSYLRHEPVFFLFIIALVIFLVTIDGYYIYCNTIVTRHTCLFTLKMIVWVAFCSDKNIDQDDLCVIVLNTNIAVKDVISIINSYLYPDKEVDDIISNIQTSSSE